MVMNLPLLQRDLPFVAGGTSECIAVRNEVRLVHRLAGHCGILQKATKSK